MNRKGRKIEPDLHALLHFQLCHVCLYLNESSQVITDCRKCGEPFQRPVDPHEDEDIQSVTPSDPFADWDDDSEDAQETQVEEQEEQDNSYRETDKGLYGLRVRW